MNEVVSSPRSVQKRSRLPVLGRRSDSVGDLVGAFESDTLAVFVHTAPTNEHIVVWTLSGMVLLALILSAVVKLDRVVESQAGFIMPTAGNLYVTPFDMGIVKELLVKPGEFVKKGQPLATLDPTFTQADLSQLQEHMKSDEAQIAREKAEIAGRPYIFSPNDHYPALQGDLWKQRQGEFRSTVDNYNGQIHAAEAQLAQASSDVEKYAARLKIANDVSSIYKPLVDKGYVANLQLLQSTDSQTEINRLLNDAKHQVPQYAETANSLRGQLAAYIKTWNAATSTQLVADENDRDTTRDALDKANKMQELTSLDAPEDSIVLQIGQVSKGSAQSGAAGAPSNLQQQPLFTLTPSNAAVEAELDVATYDVGFIRKNDPVTIKMDAFPYIRFGTVRGEVKSISEGSFSIDQNNNPVQPYFKVRVTIKKYNFMNMPKKVRLVSGSTLTGDIIVGDRTILSYLVEGSLKMAHEAMREP